MSSEKAPQNGCAHSFLKRVDQHVAVNALVLAYLVNGLFEFKIHIVSMQCQAKGKSRAFAVITLFPGRNILLPPGFCGFLKIWMRLMRLGRASKGNDAGGRFSGIISPSPVIAHGSILRDGIFQGRQAFRG